MKNLSGTLVSNLPGGNDTMVTIPENYQKPIMPIAQQGSVGVSWAPPFPLVSQDIIDRSEWESEQKAFCAFPATLQDAHTLFLFCQVPWSANDKLVVNSRTKVQGPLGPRDVGSPFEVMANGGIDPLDPSFRQIDGSYWPAYAATVARLTPNPPALTVEQYDAMDAASIASMNVIKQAVLANPESSSATLTQTTINAAPSSPFTTFQVFLGLAFLAVVFELITSKQEK